MPLERALQRDVWANFEARDGHGERLKQSRLDEFGAASLIYRMTSVKQVLVTQSRKGRWRKDRVWISVVDVRGGHHNILTANAIDCNP